MSSHSRVATVVPAAALDAVHAAVRPRKPQAAWSRTADAAVTVVDAFVTALRVGDVGTARRCLAPGLVVLVDGVVQGSREDYLAHRAAADAAVQHAHGPRLLSRRARTSSVLAWVSSERASNASGPRGDAGETETMVLARTPAGWKILHIDWSARTTTAA